MISKESIRRYYRIRTEDRGPAESGLVDEVQKESPSVLTPDPNIDDGAPMEQARPVSHEWHTRTTATASLEAKQRLMSEVRFMLKIESGSTRDIALAALEVYLDIFHIYGFNFARFALFQLSKQVTKSLDAMKDFLKNDGDWMKYFKWKNAAFFSAWMGQVQPAVPTGDFTLSLTEWSNPRWLFGGPFYSFLSRNMKDQNFRRSFSLSILQSKKGMPRPTDRMVDRAEKQALITMSSEKPQTEFTWEWKYFDVKRPLYENVPERFYKLVTESKWDRPTWGQTVYDKDRMAAQIKRTTREIFDKVTMPLESLSYYIMPSSSANYNNSRSARGTWGELEGSPMMAKMIEELRETGSPLKFQYKMTKLSKLLTEYYGEEGRVDQGIIDIQDDIREVIGLEVDDRDFLPVWRRFYWRCMTAALNEEPTAQFVGLKEALKIRCISKGPPLTYFVLKPFQKLMWRTLQKYNTFELTGTPITEELMNKRFGRLGPAFRYHSGDYSAATDELHSWASEVFADEFFDILDHNHGYSHDPMKQLFKTALTGHILTGRTGAFKTITNFLYSDLLSPLMPFELFAKAFRAKQTDPKHELENLSDELEEFFVELTDGRYFDDPINVEYKRCISLRVKQRRGQLMGSIVSFPVLCVANAALCRHAWEVAHNQVGVPLRRVPLWINGDDCLTAYQSPHFPAIWRGMGDVMGLCESIGKTYDSPVFCSINSHFFMQDEESIWRLIPYVNMGLMAGLDRSSGGAKAQGGKTPMELGPVNHELLSKCPPDCREAAQGLFLYKHFDTLREFKGDWFFPKHLFGAGLVSLDPYTTEQRRKAALIKVVLASGDVKPIKDKSKKEWALYDLFGKAVREAGPLTSKYFCKRYEHDEGYCTAFYSIVLNHWITNGLESLLASQLKNATTWPDQLARVVKFINEMYKSFKHIDGGASLRPVPQEDMVDETRVELVPVWGTSGLEQ